MSQSPVTQSQMDQNAMTNADSAIENNPHTTQPKERNQTLRECVIHSVNNYFRQVDADNISDLYQMVLAEVEAPLLQVVMKNTRSNQSKAATMLGLNRGTLRKKLKQYDMLE